MTPGAPTQVLSSRLAAPPEAVWARVQHSAFIASYLGAHLPAAALRPGQSLQGTARDGGPLDVTVLQAQPPCSLALRLATDGGHSRLSLAIARCEGGSRLTLLHEAEAAAAVPAGLAQRLAAAPAAALLAGPPGDDDALAAARGYLAETAVLVDELRRTLPPRTGHAQPAAGGFSLAQHVWHLADIEQFGWARRFERLLVEHDPLLPGVDGDRLAIERRYQQRPWRPAAARFVRQRQRSLAALAACDARVLRRPVRFGGQSSTGAEVLAAMLAHDHEHRADMALLQAGGAIHPGAPR